MDNMILINAAVELIEKMWDEEGIVEDRTSIQTRVIDWYRKSEITRPTMLAAAAISGDYRPLYYKELEQLEKFFFPKDEEDYVKHIRLYSDEALADDYISVYELESSYEY